MGEVEIIKGHVSKDDALPAGKALAKIYNHLAKKTVITDCYDITFRLQGVKFIRRMLLTIKGLDNFNFIYYYISIIRNFRNH